ncbi:ATP-binding protein [Pandoraea sputorum]|uniref:ATP-binding protein n=1 Tax=Pandoraea sputorum TaxID=93222 RepID=UPI00123F791D
MQITHGDARFPRELAQLAKIDLRILDGGGLRDRCQAAHNVLREVLDDRVAPRLIAITRPLPLEYRRTRRPGPTLAHATLDRRVRQPRRRPSKGDSMRETLTPDSTNA